MADVTALRDALMDMQPYTRDSHEYAEFSTILDALIAAVEARAAITPERLAKALHDRGLGCWEPRGPNGDLCWEVTHGNPLNDLHTPAAERILAALATDEAVPAFGTDTRVTSR